MFNKPNPRQDFFELEQAVLKWWKENAILEKSIDQRPDDKVYTFYDGPITANGEPHHGHMLTFAMKDIVPRYWTMKGYKVARSLGWDCQGIPVEYEVEKKLGFTEKKQIEEFGVAKFNQLCRESVEKYQDNIIELEEWMGRLTNSEEEYATMDRDYIESIWWSLKELHTKGLLYEGFKVVPYSTRAGTTLSNAEVALGGYKPIIDPAVTVKFPLVEDPKTMLLAWTTTPWTLPSNLGLAVGKDITYVKVKSLVPENTYIVAKDLVKAVFGNDPVEIVGELKGSELVGKDYLPPFDFFKGKANAHKIYEGFHVTTESGTGIVHLAPYGEEDNQIFREVGIESFDVLDEQGDFTDMVPDYSGMNYRDANPKIIEDLKTKDLLFKQEDYEHEMPMCWRTNTPLIYKPITSWYIAVSKLRNELVENNEKINWIPGHVKHGRFGNWLAEIKDWGISRLRYWGTPLPIWKSESGKTMLIGSYEELKELSGIEVGDPHRPYIDDVEFDYEGEHYKRIPDVLDVWYDSGAMPFARFHYPFENKEKFEKKFPAQYIAESVDQTRGWFYSLHAIATTVFSSHAFENVVMSGFVLDDKGMKLSKSKKNYTEPRPLVKMFGADTIRLNFFSTPISAGEDTTISEKTLRTQKQETILPLWNIYTYFVTYANIHNWKPEARLAYNTRVNDSDPSPWNHVPFADFDNELDAWIIMRLQQAIKETRENLDKYLIPKATKVAKDLVTDITKWYIRSNRDRFVEGDIRALEVLYYVIVETAKLLAPFSPFTSEYIYRELVPEFIENAPESIHLTDYPHFDEKLFEEYKAVLDEMEVVRKIVELGHVIRTTNNMKVRQPLARLLVDSTNPLVPQTSEWMNELLKNELNVHEVQSAFNLNEEGKVKVVEDTGLALKIGLDLEITPELKELGMLRELIRNIQAARKNMNLKIGDQIKLKYSGNEILENLISKYSEELKSGVNASNLERSDELGEAPTQIDVEGSEIKVQIEL